MNVPAIISLCLVFGFIGAVFAWMLLQYLYSKRVEYLVQVLHDQNQTIVARNEEINELKQRCTSLVSLLPIHDQQSLGYLPYED